MVLSKEDKKKTKNEKQILVMEAKPKNLSTFNYLMLLEHTLHEKNGRNYNVQIDFKSDSVKLFVEELK